MTNFMARAVALAFVTLVAFAHPAFAATRTATDKATLLAVAKVSAPGDVIQVTPPTTLWPGDIPVLPPGITLDVRGSTLNKIRLGTLVNVKLLGGRWVTDGANGSAALEVGYFDGLTIDGATFEGPGVQGLPAIGYGFKSLGGKNLTLVNSEFRGVRGGQFLTKVAGFTVERNRFSGMGADGIYGLELTDGVIRYNGFSAPATTAGSHPDAIQLMPANERYGPNQRILIEGNSISGLTQGGFCRGCIDVTFRDNALMIAAYEALIAQNSQRVTFENNSVASMPEFGGQATFDVRGSTGVVWKGYNVSAASGRHPRIVHSNTGGDPKALTDALAQLDAARADGARAQAALDAAKAELAASLAAAESARAARSLAETAAETVKAEVERLQAAWAIQAQRLSQIATLAAE